MSRQAYCYPHLQCSVDFTYGRLRKELFFGIFDVFFVDVISLDIQTLLSSER